MRSHLHVVFEIWGKASCPRCNLALGLLCLVVASCQGSASWEHAGRGDSRGAVSEGESIQAAIDAASPGDTIFVEAGHYTENLFLRGNIDLQGAGSDVTFLHGTMSLDDSEGMLVEVTISGFHITRSGAAGVGTRTAGIHVYNERAIILDNVIEGFPRGLFLEMGYMGEVRRNEITGNGVGILLAETRHDVEIESNLITFNSEAGIDLPTDVLPTIYHNTIVGNGFGGSVTTGGAGLVTSLGTRDETVNNIFVSNNAGINRIHGAAGDAHHNLVWGNAVNYANDAVAGAGDLSVDPLFVAAAAGDFRLSAGSPGIDVGDGSIPATADLDGTSRPQGLGVDMGAYERRAPASSVALVISEVMANPVDEDRGEFVEVWNGSEAPFDLDGAVLTDGDATDVIVAFGGTTVVGAGDYAVIVDPEYDGGYDIPAGTTVVTVANTTLGNGLSTSDPITLYESDGVTVLSTYSHPFDPGNGVSAERLDLERADTETNWRASPCTQSAGRPNCAPVTLAEGLIISEIMSNPVDESTGEFVELYNGTDAPLDAGSMAITDGDASDDILGWSGGSTIIPARTYAVILDPDWPASSLVFIDPAAVLLTVSGSAIGNGLAVDDPITLLSAAGEVVDTYTRGLAVSDGRSVEKVSLSAGDLRDNWAQSSCELGSSPGYLNCVSSASSGTRLPLVMTEVMANPLDEDTGEFIELYNRGIDPVDAAGLILSDGDAVDVIGAYMGGSTVIPAGAYAVIVDAEYAGEYAIPGGTVLLSTPDTTLGSSLGLEDPIRLLASNGIEVIDSFRNPFNPGNGVSAERIDVRGFDSPDNWTASSCASGSSPGEHNCSATETGLPKQIRITEVMSNQAGTEGAGEGEFIELFNMGERTVDLEGMWLAAGPPGSPTRDGIVAYAGGDTVLTPGAFALVVDQDYDGRYAVERGTVVVTVDDASIGSSGLATTHEITIYDVDGITLLGAFRYPSDPGDGISLYIVSLTAIDSAANWAATPCGATPGVGSCPGGTDVTTFTSFWVDHNMSEGGIWWYQAIGWPPWYEPSCDMAIVCPGSLYGYTYRDNFPAPVAFDFVNPYTSHSIVFEERSGPTHTCDPCGTATVTLGPGESRTVPASSLGYYYAVTSGPTLNSFDWAFGDPDLYWALPPDGVLAPFAVEVPSP